MTDERKNRSAHIVLENCGNVVMDNVNMTGGDVGIRGDVTSINANKIRMNDVAQPFDLDAGQARVSETKINTARQMSPTDGRSFLGYQRRRAAPLPAICPKCHAVFASRSYDIRSSSFYGFNNAETCRECGQFGAKLADGVFDLSEEVARIIEAEPLTYAMLAAIAGLAKSASAGEISPEQATSAVAAISPGLGSIFARYLSSPTLTSWLSIFLSALAIVLSYPSTTGSDESCTIRETVSRNGRHVQYELKTSIDRCIGLATADRIYLDEPSLPRDGGVPSDKEAPKAATAPEVVQEPQREGKSGSKYTELPRSGPLPLKRPKKP